jgi:hypothetical protein
MCLSALLMAGCSPPGPIPTKLVTGTPQPDPELAKSESKGKHKKGDKDKNLPMSARLDYESSVNACEDLATKETMGSMLTILKRLRPGAYTASYVACMKGKGYVVTQ